jgi:hypothetical protein
MVQAAPPEVIAAKPQLPLHEETAEQKVARYTDIAEDLYMVLYDPKTVPLFSGAKGRAATAVLVLGIAYHESGFAHDVDRGPCFRGIDRGHDYHTRCDGGVAACMLQIEVGDGTTREGWSRNELFADRQKCIRAGLSIMRRSFNACKAYPLEQRLSVYAQGSCASPMGIRRSRELFGQARQFRGKAALPSPDSLFMPDSDAPDS